MTCICIHPGHKVGLFFFPSSGGSSSLGGSPSSGGSSSLGGSSSSLGGRSSSLAGTVGVEQGIGGTSGVTGAGDTSVMQEAFDFCRSHPDSLGCYVVVLSAGMPPAWEQQPAGGGTGGVAWNWDWRSRTVPTW